MENSFKIGERDFKLSKINAMKQFHVVRRIGPILSEMIPAMQEITSKKQENLSEEEKLEMAAKFAGPIMNGLSRLSDKDSEFVLYTLLASVEIKQEGNYARLVVNDALMFDNLGLSLLLQVAGKAFMFNLSGFFGALQRSS